MARTAQHRDHPLSMRLQESDVAVIDRAARLKGRSRTEFIREAAVRAAEDAILESSLVRMGAEGYRQFHEALSGPAKTVPELVALFRKKMPWD